MIKLRFSEHLLTFWMLLVGGNYMLIYTVPTVRYAHYAILTVTLVRWLLTSRLPLLNPVVWGMAGGWLAALVSIVSSRYWHGLEGFWQLVVNGLLLFWLQNYTKRTDKMWGAVHAAGLLCAGVTLAEYALLQRRPVGLYLNINLNGAMLALFWLAAWRRRPWGWLWHVYALGAALLISGNRGAWLAVSAGVAFETLRGGLTRRALVGAAGVALLVALVGVVSLGRFGSDSQRWELWSAAQQMLLDQPFGVGLSNFHNAYLGGYCVAYCDDPRMMGAHNILLNIAAETGVFGLFAALVMVGAAALQLPQMRRLGRNEAAGAVLLAAVAAHNLFDYFPAASYTFLVNLAAASLLRQNERDGGY